MGCLVFVRISFEPPKEGDFDSNGLILHIYFAQNTFYELPLVSLHKIELENNGKYPIQDLLKYSEVSKEDKDVIMQNIFIDYFDAVVVKNLDKLQAL